MYKVDYSPLGGGGIISNRWGRKSSGEEGKGGREEGRKGGMEEGRKGGR